MTSNNKIPTYKLILVGDGGVGKTTFVKRHRTGDFEKDYLPTIGLDVHPLAFNTSKGPVCFNVWDTAGQERFKDIREAYYHGGNCAIVMFDVADKVTWKNVPNWCRDISAVCRIQICICGNKVDREDERKVKAVSAVRYVKKKKMEYYDISAKNNYNFEKPFLYFARLLMNDPALVFLECPVLVPPEIIIPKSRTIKMEAELERARNDDYEGAIDDDI